MQITITGHHVDVTPALHDYVTKKLEKLERRFSNITHVHVVLSLDKKFQQKAEATVHLAKAEIHAFSEEKDMYAAIDGLADKLTAQVAKHKTKLKR